MLRKLRTTAALMAGPIAATAVTAAATAGTAHAATTAAPVMTSTFVQPSISNSAPTIDWTASRFTQDFQPMAGAGIRSVIVQWTVDRDANQAYYPSAKGWFPQRSNMVGNVFSAARSAGISRVWLRLADTYDWQSHADDYTWLNNQLYDDERTADQLYALYGSQMSGWYISNEVNDRLLSTPADVAPMTWFFSSLTNYLYTHDGGKPVMEFPTYQNLTRSPARFAASCKQVLGTVDVLNVQDSGGSGYVHPSDITNWFGALHKQFAGTKTAVWDDPDLFANGAPMPPSQLQADLRAASGLVSGYSGFEFITQLDPAIVGTSTYLTAYRNYARSQS